MTTDYNDDKSCSVWKKMLTTSFWVIYPIMGICFLHVLWLMNDRMDNIMVNTNDLYEASIPFKDIDAPIKGDVIKGLDLALLKAPSKDMEKRAAEIYGVTCAACHGSKGNNGIPGARKFDSEPFKNGREFSNVYKTLENGLPPGMPAYVGTTEDKIALTHFVRTFSKESPKITDEEIKKLDEEFEITKDQGAPHRVPVAMAMELLADEDQSKSFNVNKVLFKIQKDHSAPSVLLNSVTNDLKKTLVSLNNNNIWKKDLSSFVKFVSVNIQSNGLESKLLIMDKAKLEVLHKYLVGLYQ